MKTEIYVSTTGNDLNDGTKERPFCSIIKARDTVRKMKHSGNIERDGVVVYFREGTYEIGDTVSFTGEDSGEENAPVTYCAYGDEKVKFLGGHKVPFESFKKTTDERILGCIINQKARERVVQINLRELGYHGELPHLTDMEREGEYVPEKDFVQPIKFFIGETPLHVTRYPKNGVMKMKKLLKRCQDTDYWLTRKSSHPQYIPENERNSKDPFIFIPEDNRFLNWPTDSGNGFLLGNWGVGWYQNKVAFTIDRERQTISSKYPILYTIFLGEEYSSFCAINLLCELDSEYDMWVDTNGTMYCILPENTKKKEIFFATVTNTLIRLENGCHNIVFKDIIFGKSGGKSFEAMEGSNNNLLYRCTNFGNSGITLSGKNNGMEKCKSLSGGVELKGGDVERLVPSGNYVENSELLANGSEPAVKILGGVGSRISHCNIHSGDAMLAGIYGIKHIFEYNDVYDGVRKSSDMGAVYGTYIAKGGVCDRGNIFRYNYIHDIDSDSTIQSGVCGIYTDDCSSGNIIQGNIFERINRGEGYGIHLGGSNDTIIDNNIFIELKMAVFFDDRAAWKTVNDPENSIILRNLYKVYHGYFKNKYWKKEFPELYKQFCNCDVSKLGEAWNCKKIHNISVCVGDDSIATSFKNLIIDDNCNVTKDPGFVNSKNGDYRLKPNSEIFKKIKFRQIPVGKIGMKK